nr:retrovirus-related Pol polyprotein from transposon TNT 1-94 [Tanacetum cinerariifolium]
MSRELGLKCYTRNYGSKPTSNKKNVRISQTPSRNKKNKIEAQPRKVNKKNRVVEPIRNVGVKQSQLNANSELLCATYSYELTRVYSVNSELTRFGFGSIEVVRSVATEFFDRLVPTEFARSTLREFYENVGISHQTSVAHTPRQNGVVERRNQTLVEAARTMLIFSKAPLFLWAEAINTACYTKNHSLIRLRYNKTPYELMQDKKPDLSFFHVFGSLCYPTNDNDDLGNLDAKADIGPGLHFMTPVASSSGLVPNTISQQPCIPPKRDDWDHLFQPMLNEYFNPPSIDVSPVQEAAAPRAVVLADSPVSTSIDQDAPSRNFINTRTKTFSKHFLRSSSNVRQTHTPFEQLGRWTKDHLIKNVIDDPSRSVSIRKQLQTDVMWCYFDAFLTFVEPKNFKQSMTKPSWIDAMQEEIHEFKRLQVLELVSCPDKVLLIKLKWIYKVKTDEFCEVLKNKARLVARGFMQEEGQDFNALPIDEEIVSFLRDIGHTGKINVTPPNLVGSGILNIRGRYFIDQ